MFTILKYLKSTVLTTPKLASVLSANMTAKNRVLQCHISLELYHSMYLCTFKDCCNIYSFYSHVRMT
jgi:hypothetical protein